MIGAGPLRVRDPRLSAVSLAEFDLRHGGAALPKMEAEIDPGACIEKEAYPWGRVARLLGISTIEVGKWVADGKLKVMDTSVTNRAFEAFCRHHTSEPSFSLMDPAVAK